MSKSPRRRSNAPASPSRALVPTGHGGTYPIAGTEIEASEIHRVRSRHPRGKGPWKHEAEKISWTDQASGMRCIILRDDEGTLGGYVALEQNHPLYGFSAQAIPEGLGITVHGGITYAEACDEDGPEDERICHPHAVADPLWWVGFTCDHDYDLTPGERPTLAAENGQAYRDEAYVYRQTVGLAAQLNAIGTGKGLAGDSGQGAGFEENAGSGVPLDFAPIPPRGFEQKGRNA
jgi:hypothetical protein